MYITLEYYTQDYQGIEVESEDFQRFAKRASEAVDFVTSHRITDFENLPDFIKDQIKKATAAQVEHYEKHGGPEFVGELNSVSIGKFSYGKGREGQKEQPFSREAYNHLIPTGLLYSGVRARG